ncbi:YifB family Mg chelatase-like AAA ATPase [Paenibacillus sp. IITD108]|uniref:YifB family Mg chelatase-like AAA ATPase n=1 Tax=Paenibacillus sp. IITD108 TaxID=3116649 RepID=UPI002F40D0DD
MFSCIRSASVYGVDGREIAVEVDISSGLPQLTIVGLPDPAIRESVERVRAAIKNSGFTFPMDRITVNLAPADLRKEGTAFDLAIASGILAASGQIAGSQLKDVLIIGELSLDGTVKPVPGVLAMIEQAKHCGLTNIVLPAANAHEASWISGMKLFGIHHLKQLLALRFEAIESLDSLAQPADCHEANTMEDYAEIIGQQLALRAMLIAAAGKHNMLLCGSPGTGKTMMIRRLPTILPSLTEEEALEVTKIYSVSGKLPQKISGLMSAPPFRAPHHTISAAGLIGGGSIPKPGEVTLAHHGVLFLDELAEFPRSVLEMLRQPLEDRQVTIARSRATIQFPASFILAASYNPCPCGFRNQEYGSKLCTCSPAAIARYLSRLSGPLLDRFDLQLEISRPASLREEAASADSTAKQYGNNSADMKRLVKQARELAWQRNSIYGVRYNSQLAGAALKKAANMNISAARLLDYAFQKLSISMRAYDRLLRLARTIADIEQMETVTAEHIAEAIQYRKLEEKTTDNR